MSLNLLFANLISLVIFFILYKKRKIITKKFNLIDYPDKIRKLHKVKTPLIGGLLILFSIIYLVIVDQLFMINNNYISKIIIILLPIFIMGLLDDIYNIFIKYNQLEVFKLMKDDFKNISNKYS
jgi:UDP-N-acetylmuramyl pentapeptide phosphotransferase/UDP-N-acetylglucosamine-1-phosphate transferase